MLAAAAFAPIPPLLVPEIASGSAGADEALRVACGKAVSRLIGPVDEIVVVGPGEETGPLEGSWDWRAFGVALPDPAPQHKLPHGLAIGSWLLDTYAGVAAPACRFHAVSADLSPQDCAALGSELVAGEGRVGLLICGDGSACRTEKAPGYFDPAAQPWDDTALTALRDADPAGLLSLDAAVGRRLLAAGRAPWQVLAGAAAGGVFEATVDWADAPYGVMYIAGTWTREDMTAT